MLRGLHDLDIFDKHKLLIPVTSLINVLDLELMDATGNTISFKNRRIGPVKDGMILESWPITQPAKFSKDIQAPVEITFGRGQPFENEPVLATLSELAELVECIVETFSTFYRK